MINNETVKNLEQNPCLKFRRKFFLKELIEGFVLHNFPGYKAFVFSTTEEVVDSHRKRTFENFERYGSEFIKFNTQDGIFCHSFDCLDTKTITVAFDFMKVTEDEIYSALYRLKEKLEH